MIKIAAIIGDPIKHSISPAFQQASFDHYDLGIRYEKWEVWPEQLEGTIKLLRLPLHLGVNVTIPHKEAVIPMLDELDDLAVEIGAVNTIVNRDGKLIGYNTDAPAFIKALRQDGGFEPEDKEVILLGAGGAARAVGLALLREKVKSLVIANRTIKRAEKLAATLKEKSGSTAGISTIPWSELERNKPLSNCDLLVNCTSIGMQYGRMEDQTPLEAVSIPKDALVYDLVYNPIETPLLREAKKAGANTLGGLAMLVYQGAAAFELWVGREAPIDVMFSRAREALN